MRSSRGKFAAHSTSVTFAAVSIVLVLAVAACGGDDGNKDGGGGTGTPQATVGARLQVLDSVPILRNEHDLDFNLEDVSADGRQLLLLAFKPLAGSACGSLIRLSLDGQLATLAKDASQVSFGLRAGHAIFSPGGDRVAYLATDDCAARETATLKTLDIGSGATAKTADGASRVWSWTAEEKILFDMGPAAHPALWEVGADGAAAREVAARDAIDVSRDGRWLAYLEGGAVTFEGVGGSTRKTPGTPVNAEIRFLSPDGRRYVYAGLDQNGRFDRLEIYDLDAGAVSGAIGAEQLKTLNTNPPFEATWSSDGAFLFLQGVPPQGEGWPAAYALSPDGAVAAKLTTSSGGLGSALAARGLLVFYRSGNDIWVAVLSGEGGAPADPETLKAAIRSAFPAPVPLTLE